MISPTLSLFVSNIKMLMRDRQALFWSLLFPLMFLVIFGLFNFEEPSNFQISIFDDAGTDSSRQLKENLLKMEIFEEKNFANKDEAIQKIKDGELDGIITIPTEFSAVGQDSSTSSPQDASGQAGQAPSTSSGQASPIVFPIIIDETNLQSPVIGSILTQYLNEVNLQITGSPRLFEVKTDNVESKDVKYLDFLMPGVLGMSIMFSAVIGIAVAIARYRERKILKRLVATPIKIRSFLIAEVGAYLFLTVLQVILILSAGRLIYHIEVYGNYFYLAVVALFGTIIFLNLGFFVAGRAKTVNTAEAMSNAFITPMMFLSGVFFSPEMLPQWLQKIVEYLPLTGFLKVLRGISVNGLVPWDFPKELAIMAGWVIVSFFLAWKSFRVKNV